MRSDMAKVRKAAVAGSWYPGSAPALAAAVDRHLAKTTRDVPGDLVALIAPHAGLMYSGPVAAHAYRLLRGRTFDIAALVGPSHFVGFDGVSVYPSGGFETPFGVTAIDSVRPRSSRRWPCATIRWRTPASIRSKCCRSWRTSRLVCRSCRW
jgi:AmmeMemoRadiSam system protein B